MIEAIHKHLLAELDRAGRSDTVFTISGVLFNLFVLIINWIQALSTGPGSSGNAAFVIFAAGSLLVTGACLLNLLGSRRICTDIHSSLSKIYVDAHVEKYLPESMSRFGPRRSLLSIIIVAGMGSIAILVPAATMYFG